MSIKHTRVFPYRDSKIIESFDINESGKLKISAIATSFQEVAWKHAAELDYGFHDLKEKALHWVLAKTIIKVNRYPSWTEETCIRTWPSDIEKLFFIRDFQISDTEVDVCIEGSSYWLVVNSEGRPQIPSHIRESIPLYPDEERIMPKKSIPEKPDEYKLCFEKKARQSDIDVHHHVNNVRYYEWMIDCLSENGVNETELTYVEMSFLSEFCLGDSLKVYFGKKDGTYFVKGTKDTKDVFHAKVM